MRLKTYSLTTTHIIEPTEDIALKTQNLEVFYGQKQAVFDVNLNFPENKITALIGASGSGKSTLLRSLNRLNQEVATVKGQILYHDIDLNAKNINVYAVRQQIGMVFQRPNPFAISIKENVLFGPKQHGQKDKHKLDQLLEDSLKGAALWDEVKDKLNKSALSLSGGQQQRLCIARALAMQPEIMLLDEPASALDPVSTAKLEVTLQDLRPRQTIIIVTHNLEQASRLSDYTAFMHKGHLLEFDKTKKMFTLPELEATNDYLTGKFG